MGVLTEIFSRPMYHNGMVADVALEPASYVESVDFMEAKGTKSDWIPYKGPKGGRGWKNIRTDKVHYGIHPPVGLHNNDVEPEHQEPHDVARHIFNVMFRGHKLDQEDIQHLQAVLPALFKSDVNKAYQHFVGGALTDADEQRQALLEFAQKNIEGEVKPKKAKKKPAAIDQPGFGIGGGTVDVLLNEDKQDIIAHVSALNKGRLAGEITSESYQHNLQVILGDKSGEFLKRMAGGEQVNVAVIKAMGWDKEAKPKDQDEIVQQGVEAVKKIAEGIADGTIKGDTYDALYDQLHHLGIVQNHELQKALMTALGHPKVNGSVGELNDYLQAGGKLPEAEAKPGKPAEQSSDDVDKSPFVVHNVPDTHAVHMKADPVKVADDLAEKLPSNSLGVDVSKWKQTHAHAKWAAKKIAQYEALIQSSDWEGLEKAKWVTASAAPNGYQKAVMKAYEAAKMLQAKADKPLDAQKLEKVADIEGDKLDQAVAIVKSEAAKIAAGGFSTFHDLYKTILAIDTSSEFKKKLAEALSIPSAVGISDIHDYLLDHQGKLPGEAKAPKKKKAVYQSLSQQILASNVHEMEPTWKLPEGVNPQDVKFGGVVFNEKGQVLLREPTGHYDGYKWTWPKGSQESGMHPLETAWKEVAEETGHKGEVIGLIPGIHSSGDSHNAYFAMVSKGHDPKLMDQETASTKWVNFDEAAKLIKQTKNAQGKARDLAVLKAAKEAWEMGLKDKHGEPEAEAPVEAQQWHKTGDQLGSNPGGKFKDPKSGKEYYVKFSKSEDHAKNEVLGAKLYELTGASVPSYQLANTAQGLGTATEWLTDTGAFDKNKVQYLESAFNDFAVHVWLSNYDAVGQEFDNQVWVNAGGVKKLMTIDTGGSLLYRAQGAKKGTGGTNPFTIDSVSQDLKDATSKANMGEVFGKMTPTQQLVSLKKVAAVSDEAIDAMVEKYGPGKDKKELAEILKKRRDYLAGFAEGIEASLLEGKALPETGAVEEADELPAAVDALPASHKAVVKGVGQTVKIGSFTHEAQVVQQLHNIMLANGMTGSEMIALAKAMGAKGSIELSATAAKKIAAILWSKHAPSESKPEVEELTEPAGALPSEVEKLPASLKAAAISTNALPTGGKTHAMLAKEIIDVWTANGLTPKEKLEVAKAFGIVGAHALDAALKLAAKFKAEKEAAPVVFKPMYAMDSSAWPDEAKASLKAIEAIDMEASKADVYAAMQSALTGLSNGQKYAIASSLGAVGADFQGKMTYEAAADMLIKQHEAYQAKQPKAKAPKAKVAISIPPVPWITSGHNAGHNKKLQKIYDAAQHAINTGDLSKLEAIPTNSVSGQTYTKKVHKYKMAVLAALKSGATSMTALPASMKAAPTAAAKPAVKPKVDPDKVPEPPWANITSGSEEKLAKKKKAAQEIYDLAKAGNLTALQAYDASISQTVNNYKEALIAHVDEVLNPPPPPAPKVPYTGPLSELTQVVGGMKEAKSLGHETIGYYIVVGEPGVPDITLPKVNLYSSHSAHLADAKEHQKHVKAIQKLKPYTLGRLKSHKGSTSHEGFWGGDIGQGTQSDKAYGKDLLTHSPELPAGTIMTRFIDLTSADFKKMKNAAGKLLQDPAPVGFTVKEGGTYGTGANVRIDVQTLPGAQALYIGHEWSHQKEREIIMPPGSRILIKEVIEKAGKIHVKAIMMPTVEEQCCD